MFKLTHWIFKTLFRVSVLLLIFYWVFTEDDSTEVKVEQVLNTKGEEGGRMLLNFRPSISTLKKILGGFWTTAPTRSELLLTLEDSLKNKFIRRFQRVAVVEQKKFGIPSSIIMANSLLLSQAGTSALAKQGNNFFALLATTDWIGDTLHIDSKVYRRYENAWGSFRDHSYYLTTGGNNALKKIPSQDFKSWAKLIGEEVYADELNYTEQIKTTIQAFGLDKLDTTN